MNDDTTNKIMLGHLKLEIEGLQKRFQQLENEIHYNYQRKKEWHYFGSESLEMVFENGSRDLIHIPRKLLYIIVRSFESHFNYVGTNHTFLI